MKLDNSLRNRLEKSEWWFLERLDYVGARLIVEVVEGCVSSITEDVSIDGAGVIADVRPVEVTELSKRLRIEFVNVLAYQVIDESYYGVPSSGELEELDISIEKFGVNNFARTMMEHMGVIILRTKDHEFEIFSNPTF